MSAAALRWAREKARAFFRELDPFSMKTPTTEWTEQLAALLYSARRECEENAIRAMRRNLLDASVANNVEHGMRDRFTSAKLWEAFPVAMPTTKAAAGEPTLEELLGGQSATPRARCNNCGAVLATSEPGTCGVCERGLCTCSWKLGQPYSPGMSARAPHGPDCPAGICGKECKSHDGGRRPCVRPPDHVGECSAYPPARPAPRPPAARLDGAAPSGLDAAIAALGKLGQEDAGAAVVGGALVGLLGGLLLGGGRAQPNAAGEGVLTSKTRVHPTQVRQEPGIKGGKAPKSPTKQRGVKSQQKKNRAKPPSV